MQSSTYTLSNNRCNGGGTSGNYHLSAGMNSFSPSIMDDDLSFLDFSKLSYLVASGASDDVQRLNILLKKLSSSHDGWALCATILLDQHPEYKCTDVRQAFFLCRVIETFLRERYSESAYDSTRHLIHNFLHSIFILFSSPMNESMNCVNSHSPNTDTKSSNITNNNIPLFPSSSTNIFRPLFLRNKAAQLFALTAAHDYGTSASPWTGFIQDLLKWVGEASSLCKNSFEQVVVYDFYLRIFLSIHEDVIGEGGEHECSPTSTRVKDYMREGDAKCMLQSWADILHFCVQCRTDDSIFTTLAVLCCKVMSYYASWMDIGLLTERYLLSGIMELIAAGISPKSIQNQCQFCVYKALHYLRALSTKGMPPVQKVQLCDHLWRWMTSLNSMNAIDLSHLSQEEEGFRKFLDGMAELLNSMSMQLLLAYKDLQRERSLQGGPTDSSLTGGIHSVITPEFALQSAEEKLDAGIALLSPRQSLKPTATTLDDDRKRDLSNTFLESWREYLSTLKTLAPNSISYNSGGRGKSSNASGVDQRNRPQTDLICTLSPERQNRVLGLLMVVIEAMRYPSDYSFEQEGEDEEDFQELRKELRIIFSNIVHLAPSMVLDHIYLHFKQLFVEGNPQRLLATVDFPQVEVILSAFYHFGESVPRVRCELLFDRRQFIHSEKMSDLMKFICSSAILYLPNKEILLLFFELVVRYEAFFTSEHLSLLTDVLKAMLDERGIRSLDRRVRLRSAYLFSRFIRSHKDHVKPFTSDILRGIADLLILPQPDHLRELNGENVASDQCQQQAFIYETAAQLIFSTYGHMPYERVQYLAQLHTHILHSVPGLVDVWLEHRSQLLSSSRTTNNSISASASLIYRRKREERCRECAQWLKSAMEMISRTSKVFSVQQPVLNSDSSVMNGLSSTGGAFTRKRTGSSSASSTQPSGPLKTPNTTGCAHIFLDALRVFAEAWQRLRNHNVESLGTDESFIWQNAGFMFLSGLRSFIHRMVAVCAPSTNPEEPLDGQWLLDVLPSLMPLLYPSAIALRASIQLEKEKCSIEETGKSDGLVECVRCVREFLPLVNQIIVQFKSHASPLVSMLLETLLDSVQACIECQRLMSDSPSYENQGSLFVGDPELLEELKLVRRSVGQFLSHITTYMAHVFHTLGATRFQLELRSLLSYCNDSLLLSDAMTLKQLLLTLRQLILTWYAEESFRHHFIYSHIVELLFTMPVHRGFRLEDGQFFLVLNEIGSTWQILADKMGEEVFTVLQTSIFPRYQIPEAISSEFLRHLKCKEDTSFPTYLKKFYTTCKGS